MWALLLAKRMVLYLELRKGSRMDERMEKLKACEKGKQKVKLLVQL